MTLEHPLVVPAIRLRGGDVDREARRALTHVRAPWVAGFCLFGGEVPAVARLLQDLREAAGRPIFVASDMECGAGQQVAGLPLLPEAALWGAAATPAEVERLGEMTARAARSVGVDVLFAPVLDVLSEVRNPIVGHRAFGSDPGRVAVLGAAYVRGALAGGALPVLKHFPGHGATLADSHEARPVVEDSADRLLTRDVAPFLAVLARTPCPAVMTAHVAYPALDAKGAIATFSRPVLQLLREAPGGKGVAVFTDALCMEGARGGIGEAEAARRSVRAGCDLLLCPDDPEGVVRGLASLPAEDLRRAGERVRAFLGRSERRREVGSGDEAADAGLAREVTERAVDRSWDGRPETGSVLVLDDDGIAGRGEALLARGAAAGVEVGVWRVPDQDASPREARAPGTVVVMASVRAYKGAGGLSAPGAACLRGVRDRARGAVPPLQVVWCGVRGPGDEPHVPGTTPIVEQAVARRILPSRS